MSSFHYWAYPVVETRLRKIKRAEESLFNLIYSYHNNYFAIHLKIYFARRAYVEFSLLGMADYLRLFYTE